MNENKMKSFKKIYWDIKLSSTQVEQNWQDLKTKINPSVKIPFFRFGFMVIIFLLVAFIGTIGLAQASSPGTALYPIKILSDQIFAKVSQQPQIPTEKRMEEVIDVSKKEPEKIDETAKEYRKALEESEKEVEKEEKNQEKLRKSLNKQEQKIKEAIKENPKSQEKLEKVLEDTRETKENLKKEDRSSEKQD